MAVKIVSGSRVEPSRFGAARVSPQWSREPARSLEAARPARQGNGGNTAAIATQPCAVAREGLSEPEFSVGEVIEGVYEVIGILGRGRRFSVYRARQRRWDAVVAIKVPRAELLSDAAALQSIVNATTRWTALGLHPHVAYCYHVHVVGGVPLLVLEDFDGGNLRPWIADGRCASLRRGLEVAIQICHGLEHAHAAGLCHGALRPENVLLTSTGLAAVGDFAIARRAPPEAAPAGGNRARVADGQLDHGPETYRAPERWIGGEPLAPAADIFALGVCLYEMFCGLAPYEMTRGPRREAPEPCPPGDGEPLPGRLAALLKRCVDWDVDRRPPGVAEIRRELCAVHLEALGCPSPFAELPHATWEADGWNNRAVSALLLGRHADADAAWQSALSVDPRHLATIYNYGITRWWRGDLTDEALVEQLSQVRSSTGRDVSASHLLALVHLDRGDAASAVALLEEAQSRGPRVPEIEHALGLARARLSARAEPRELGGHRAFVSSVSLSEDGRFVLSASDDCTLRLWEAHTGCMLRAFEGHENRVGAVALCADGETAISGGDDFTLRIWDVKSGQCADTVSLAGNVFSVAISGDAGRAVSASSASDNFIGVDNTEVLVWDLQRRRLRAKLEGHGNATKSVAITADGRWAITGSDDLTVRVWDASTGACRRVLSGHEHYVSCVSVRSDGKVAMSGSWDKTLRLWDTSTGRCLRVFEAGAAIVTSVCLSADGRLAISGGWDGSVRLWEVETGCCLRTFAGHGSLVTGVALSADGRTAVSGSWDRTVRVWSVPQPGERLCSPRPSVRVPYAPLPAA
jgi:serine/threonine protein kinase